MAAKAERLTDRWVGLAGYAPLPDGRPVAALAAYGFS